MNFFEAQELAKQRTGRLVFLFGLAVLGTLLACYAAAMFLVGGGRLWDPMIFAVTTLVVTGIVGISILVKRAQLSEGGPAVASMMGARRIVAASASELEKRLLNVVEEMSIASGVPMPGVYVMDEETGINAFAAGMGTQDAVVAVTRGTLERLTRDELQGVVAHEFSHILNGDMRMNMRMTSVLFGILVLGLIGRGLLEAMGRGRVRVGGKKDNPAAVLLGIGLALLIIGYVGYFFGRLIQSGISRQREFLADASAVQFTRYPQGIAGALMKIGGAAQGSHVEASRAGEFRHFFFAEGTSSWLSGMFATHPDLGTRIKAVLPAWDGKYVATAEPAGLGGGAAGLARNAWEQGERPEGEEAGAPPPLPRAAAPMANLAGDLAAGGGRPAPAKIPYAAGSAVANAGRLADEHFEKARELLGRIPAGLRMAAESTADAPALVAALLLHGQSLPAGLACKDPVSAVRLADLHGQSAALEADLRLPLVQIAINPLRALTAPQRVAMMEEIRRLMALDGETTPFEFAVFAMVARTLGVQASAADEAGGQVHSFQAVGEDLRVMLSALAWSGAEDEAGARRALAAGFAQLKVVEGATELLSAEACTAQRLLGAMQRVGGASLPIRRRFLTAASHVAGSDGTITLAEAELLRAMALAVDCPLPVW
jgi:Zn-dependent protease with chaperone function